MSTPDERKTMQVSPAVHAAVHELATQLDTSADGALRHLLDKSTIRVQAPEPQRRRWTVAAERTGLPLPQWISHQVEAALQNDPVKNAQTLAQIFYRVDLLCQAAGVSEPKQRRTLKEKNQ